MEDVKFMEEKRLIYYPSLSVGTLNDSLTKNEIYNGNLPARYYSKDMKDNYPLYYHPYYLVTAGHYYKKPTYSKDMGLFDNDEVVIFGDSGGYQIGTGILKFSDEMIDKIYTWLENNAHVAPIIDIPPSSLMNSKKLFKSFDDCLEVSYNNTTALLSRPKTNTSFLNVMQGYSYGQIDQWFEKMNTLKLDGWCLGSRTNKINALLYKLAVLKESDELNRDSVKYLHIFGVSKISDFILLTRLQKILNELTDNRVQLSLDSSSPGRSAAFGSYFSSFDLKRMSFGKTTFSNKFTDWSMDSLLPCDCPACDGITYETISQFNTSSYSRMILHNLYKYLDVDRMVYRISNSHVQVGEDLFNKKFMKVVDSMESIMLSNSPKSEFRKYINLYGEINAGNEIDSKLNNLDNFFNN